MLQLFLVFALFAAAVVYVGRSIYRNMQTRSSCASGCGKCGVDLSKIETKLKQDQLLKR